jgi:hypothetical protein
MEIVSLGNNCAIAYQLKRYNLRNNAYPFDWLKIKDFSDLNKILDNDFEEIFHKENFKLKNVSDKFPIENYKDDISYIYENNNIQFCHDFSSDFEKSYQNFVDKYKRRVYRLYDLIHSDKEIHFIRDEWKYNEDLSNKINEFKNIIYKINPYCKYKLSVIINTDKPIDIGIKNSNIIFDINKIGDWTRSNIDWQYIFDTENMPNERITNTNFLYA